MSFIYLPFYIREVVKHNGAILSELLTTPTLEALLKVVERGNGDSVKEIMELTVLAAKENKINAKDILLRYGSGIAPTNAIQSVLMIQITRIWMRIRIHPFVFTEHCHQKSKKVMIMGKRTFCFV